MRVRYKLELGGKKEEGQVPSREKIMCKGQDLGGISK